MKFSVLLVGCALGIAQGTAAPVLKSGVNTENGDPSVRPQDDLYLATNGHWLKTVQIPADKSNYGAFTALDDAAREHIRELIVEASEKKQAAGTDAKKVGDMYRSFMDEAQIEKLGIEPLRSELTSIGGLKDISSLVTHWGYLTQIGVQTPLGFDVGPDKKNSQRYIAGIEQSGLGLPDRDYYLLDEPRFVEGRSAYVAYITQLLVLSGHPQNEASAAALRILALETEFARAHSTKVELRDPEKNYHKVAVASLAQVTPNLPWKDYLGGLGIKVEDVDVNQPSFVAKLGNLLESTPLSTWKEYLEFKLLDAYAIGLPAAFQKAHFQLHGTAIAGIPEDKSRSKKAVELISGDAAGDFGVLGDVVGKLFVEKYFPPEAKTRMDRLVGNLLAAYDDGIRDLTWMTPETKAKARAKLAKYSTKIAYPKRWRDYSALTIRPDDLVGNLLASQRHEYAYESGKLGKPVDKQEWQMTPQTVNAYYNPPMNEIVFPAAILQPPFFNVEADDAVNYGGIGAVIGHEISHGFDDKGSKYDGDGNLNNWWIEADRSAFEALTQKLVEQYNAYEPLPGLHVNGQLTLGENIADLSGLAVAYRAYRLSLKGAQAPVIDGMTGDQRFFMGWAQVWARKYRDPEMVKRIKTDPHSPSHYRANGAPINSDAFADAFGVKPGDGMYKEADSRIRIW